MRNCFLLSGITLCTQCKYSDFSYVSWHKENIYVLWLFSCLHGEEYSPFYWRSQLHCLLLLLTPSALLLSSMHFSSHLSPLQVLFPATGSVFRTQNNLPLSSLFLHQLLSCFSQQLSLPLSVCNYSLPLEGTPPIQSQTTRPPFSPPCLQVLWVIYGLAGLKNRN